MGYPWKKANLIDLSMVRHRLSVPTGLLTRLLEMTGTQILSASPGKVRAQTPDGSVLEVTVKPINVFEREARLYLQKGEPVPERVLADLERWELENGRTS